MANILGISIGTRNVGLAVIRLRKLTDYRIRTFPGKWTEAKCEDIWDMVETIIKREGITDIVIKLPPRTHRSENLDGLVKGIEELGKWFHIEVLSITVGDFKRLYLGAGKNRRQVMVEAIIERHPEVKKLWNDGKRAQAYRAKIFEAIACAELALRAGH